MAEETTRGSDRLFNFEAKDSGALAEAIGAARDEYRVKWWWKYGQPAIDRIKADLEIDRERFGGAIARIMELNGPRLQVTAEVFPYGLPNIEGFRVQLDISQPRG